MWPLCLERHLARPGSGDNRCFFGITGRLDVTPGWVTSAHVRGKVRLSLVVYKT